MQNGTIACNLAASRIFRVGQNRIHTPYMPVYLMQSLHKLPYINRIYIWF